MNIKKCDVCDKDIEFESMVVAGFGFRNKEFCMNCGKPILNFLKKHKFIDKNNEIVR